MDKDEGNCCSLAGFVCGAGVELGERHQNYQINEQCNSPGPYFGQPERLQTYFTTHTSKSVGLFDRQPTLCSKSCRKNQRGRKTRK